MTVVSTGMLAVVAVGYTATSIALTFFQKRVMTHHPFPAFIVTAHYILKFIYSTIGRILLTCTSGRTRTLLTFEQVCGQVALVGIFSALDICFSQWSLELVSVTVYTLVKTTTIVWIFLFGVCLATESCNGYSIATTMAIFSGLLVLAVDVSGRHSVAVSASSALSQSSVNLGIVLISTAALLAGIRWAITQKTLHNRNELGLQNPIDFMFHIQPIMIVTLIPFVIYIEGAALLQSRDGLNFANMTTGEHFVIVIVIGSVIAFTMELLEYTVVTISSSMTLCIISAVKEVITVVIDIVVFQSVTLNYQYILGMCLVFLGVALRIKHKASVGLSPNNGDTLEDTMNLIEALDRSDQISGNNEDISDNDSIFPPSRDHPDPLP